ncbi:MAG: hypothetical protein R2824_19890 [Saprospiraceae bacterium]|nr:hypothetical protein [Lewinella sp.]
MINTIHRSPVLLGVLVMILALGACRKEEALVVDVPFTADKTTVSIGESVTFSVGAGAAASSLYTGDSGHDFAKSRISLVELEGYTEEELRTGVYAERIPGLQEFIVVVPKLTTIPSDYSFTGGGDMSLYDGQLVPWDFSNSTDSRYIRLNLASSAPHVFSFRPNNAVIPTMLDLNNGALGNLGALNRNANNNFSPFAAFPDGFDSSSSQNGITVKFGVQVVIDGQASAIRYYTQPVRELLDDLSFNIDALINQFQTDFPDVDPSKGIEEMRLIFNADDPTVTDDDGDLLAYTGNVYIQEMRIGSADNMVKGFDRGVTIPFVYEGTEQVYAYTYNEAGTYVATLVSSFIGRKQYSGDGYRTDRPDEILASEYDIERTFKTITITVVE